MLLSVLLCAQPPSWPLPPLANSRRKCRVIRTFRSKPSSQPFLYWTRLSYTVRRHRSSWSIHMNEWPSRSIIRPIRIRSSKFCIVKHSQIHKLHKKKERSWNSPVLVLMIRFCIVSYGGGTLSDIGDYTRKEWTLMGFFTFDADYTILHTKICCMDSGEIRSGAGTSGFFTIPHW